MGSLHEILKVAKVNERESERASNETSHKHDVLLATLAVDVLELAQIAAQRTHDVESLVEARVFTPRLTSLILDLHQWIEHLQRFDTRLTSLFLMV